jgi:4-aminobutyrate aminotransferase-like enzyme
MKTDILSRRNKVLGKNFPTFYDKPIHLVRGEGVWLYDSEGKKYLDCYNNVPHVGHCHPKVVEAISNQASTLNTHTRYLHEGILEYAEKLCSKFSNNLDQMIMVCTGSEANDIALRMAQAVTGKSGFIATDNTYHGNTGLVSQLSARRPPIGGYSKNIRLIPAPESTHPLGGSHEVQSEIFAKNVERAIYELEKDGYGFAGFMFCPIFANEGFPTVPPGFLDPTVKVIKSSGGLIKILRGKINNEN